MPQVTVIAHTLAHTEATMIKMDTVLATWLLNVMEQFQAQGVVIEDLAEAKWLQEASAHHSTRPLMMVAVRRHWHQAMRVGESPLLRARVGVRLQRPKARVRVVLEHAHRAGAVIQKAICGVLGVGIRL